MCRNRKAILLAPATRASRPLNEFVLFSSLEGSLFNPFRSDIASRRAAEECWTDITLIDSWFTYSRDLGEVLGWPEGRTTPFWKRSLEGHALNVGKILLARSVRFAADRLLSMDAA